MRWLLRLPARLPRALGFALYFLWRLALANLYVVWEVATPRHSMRPGIVEVPIRSSRPIEIVALANLISLTPGTLTLEVSEDERALYVHALHLRSPEHLRAQIGRLEDRLLRVLR